MGAGSDSRMTNRSYGAGRLMSSSATVAVAPFIYLDDLAQKGRRQFLLPQNLGDLTNFDFCHKNVQQN